MKVEVSDQVSSFVQSQAPEARRRLRLGLRRLAREQGDIRALEGRLRGYHRLRVGVFRVIFARAVEDGNACIRCAFAERRGIVHTVLDHMIEKHVLQD